jgi:hypothetical protein
MTAVYVLTAGSGDTYRIERVDLDSDEAHRFAQDYNGIAPVEPEQVEEWQVGAPPSPTTALPACGVVGAHPPRSPSGALA